MKIKLSKTTEKYGKHFGAKRRVRNFSDEQLEEENPALVTHKQVVHPFFLLEKEKSAT